MTDTDDTDDLLLIPPDFFIVKSDSEHSETIDPYHNIIDSLIQQVGKLQSRLKSIESSDSFFSTSLDYSNDKSNKMKGFRKYNSSDDLYIPPSTQSTPPKTDNKLQLNSLPNTPSTIRNFREFKSPPKHSISPKTNSIAEKDGRVLNEIDTFLSRVKTIQRINAVRNLEKDFISGGPTTDREKPKPDVKQNKTEGSEPMLSKGKTWQVGDTIESVPDLGLGPRDTLYKYADGDHISVNYRPDQFSTQSSTANESLTSIDRYSASDGSSDSTQMTAFRDYSKQKSSLLDNPIHSNALNVLNMHKQVLEDSAKKINTKSKGREQKYRSTNTVVSDDLGLVNLADIWNQNSNLNPVRAAQKLQEEKLRRQHCETLIQELQHRNLELQQKLSVAVRVDESKNKVISQFQDALEKIISKTQVIQREKRERENEFSKSKAKHKSELDEAMQKIAYYEKELSKALNLMHGNQDKVSSLEKRYNDLENEVQVLEVKYKESQELLVRETDKNKQLSEILSEKEIEINENKNALNTARSEVAKSRKAVEICQDEFNKLKNESEALRNDLRDEKNRVVVVEDQKRELLRECEEYKKREERLHDEINKIDKQLQSSKIELRNFYQGQVELLVQNKLKEFQSQLEQAEASFKEEFKKRELTIAKTAALHIQQISEKYSLEIKLIEQKHQEEAKLYQIQIMQYKQQVDHLQSKLEHFQEKRVQIAQQLQKIMETQWSEALRIIASGKSPNEANEDSFSTIDQLNSLKTRSYNNVEELLVGSDEHNIIRNQKERPFELYNEENVDNPDVLENVEPSMSSKSQGQKPYSENDIQKYINLLLNKPQGTTEGPSRGPDKNSDSERGSWMHEQTDPTRMGSKYQMKDKRYPKPPGNEPNLI